MSTTENSLPLNWKKPDELLRLQRLKQKKKQLAARISHNRNNNEVKTNVESDKAALLEAKIVQKRKNPFAKSVENAKKYKTDIGADGDDFLVKAENASTTAEKEAIVRETPTRPPPAKLVLQPFDPKAFSELLRKSTSAQSAADDEDVNLDDQKITKHLPIDWSLKTRVRFFCRNELPSTQLKTSQLASGLTSFVRCINTQTEGKGLDLSPATRFNQATYYWQHPHIPWMTLFPRNSRDNTGITLGEKERNALSEDWNYSFKGLFHLLRARQCAYFYLCGNTFTVLFRAAGVGGRAEMHAFMSPTTHGLRQSLRQEGIEFSMPLKKDKTGSQLKPDSSDSTQLETEISKEEGSCNADSEEEEEEEEWLERLDVDVEEIWKIQSAHERKLKSQEMSEDFSDNSLMLIEGAECQGFFSFLLNAKSTIGTVGRLAGVPPTLLAPVAFPKATMQHLNTRSSKVRMDGIDYYSIEVKGVILPSFLPYTCQLLGETKETFSATLASSVNTLAFSKATQKLLQDHNEPCSGDEKCAGDEAASQVFGQENLSDCGLGTCVVESMCQTGQQSVALLERVCYDKEHGYAWS
uniref:Protein downstream neighbor of son homolog n=1 Tax=Glossina pallidipes TaxID=7398 RepID=A0A1B0A1N1_GLOPL